jgi:hypothetical protein
MVAHDITERLWPTIGRHYKDDNDGEDLAMFEDGEIIMPADQYHRLAKPHLTAFGRKRTNQLVTFEKLGTNLARLPGIGQRQQINSSRGFANDA